ncbi:MAG: gliding motility-associated ABC transporter permease subunit GldF [Crocinitomicaceae bacterium]|jgi:ABC-2 type transport system permease protein|nr:gliding motility-associated ABC transporter permease subunit GldF [Crocinitomicaceae bacterium]
MKALYLKEIRSFLSSIIGYIFIFIYLIASGLFHWIISENTNLLEGEEADLIPFFNLSPVIFLILIPAITMRSIAEERRTGTIELLFTRPLSDFQILLAKYWAGVTLVALSLIPTLVYYFSMYQLGNPVGVIDTGATITSYLGLLLLGSVFVAIGIFASSITSSQIVAFILSMFICWLFYDGFNLLGSYKLLGSFDTVIQYIGMAFHYDSIKRGVIDTKDLVYFFSVITLFLFAALTVIKSLKK